MRFFSEIIGIVDPFFLISTLAIFVCDVFGAFAFLLTTDILENKALDVKHLI